MEVRTLVALAATLICAAVAANATSPVQTAREQEAAPPPASLDEPDAAVPDSPLAIAGPLADHPALQIQLGSADPEPRRTTPLDVPFESPR